MNDEKIFESLTGTVEKITYKNAENGFTVLKLSDGEKLHTVVGTMPDVITGMILDGMGRMDVPSELWRTVQGRAV